MAPQVAEIFARTAQPFFQPILDPGGGRVALLGDAAFVARPHVGAGVDRATLDAASLADAGQEQTALPPASCVTSASSSRSAAGW